jgi:hypothetical protein
MDHRRAAAVARARAKRQFRSLAGMAVVATIVLNVIWLAGGSGAYWPLWAMISFAILLLFTGYRAYGPSGGDVTEEEIEREERRGQR